MTEGSKGIRPKGPEDGNLHHKAQTKDTGPLIENAMRHLPPTKSTNGKPNASLYSEIVHQATPSSRLKKLDSSLTNEEVNSVTKGFVASCTVLGHRNETLLQGLQEIGSIEGKLTVGIAGIAIEQVKGASKKASPKEQIEAKTTGQIRAGLGLIAEGIMTSFRLGIPKENFGNLPERHVIKKLDQDPFKGIRPK